jgi:hypothetical protein
MKTGLIFSSQLFLFFSEGLKPITGFLTPFMCGTKTKTEIVLIYFIELALKVLHKK